MSADRSPRLPGWDDRYIPYLVPALSFGGLALGLGLQAAGIIRDAGDFWYGSFAASLLLGYLAYRKPRKDIVSLCAPLFGFLIFVTPLETKPGVLLQILFAISITALVIRHERKFPRSPDGTGGPDGSPTTTHGVGTRMEQYLDDYIERLRPLFSNVGKKAAHEVASVFFSFKFGLYENAVSEADSAASLLPPGGESETALRKALAIIRERSVNLRDSDISKPMEDSFVEWERAYLAMVVPEDRIEDKETFQLHNALLLLYAVASLRSPDDEEALGEHRKYVTGILNTYRRLLR